jgi:hypothetical protein
MSRRLFYGKKYTAAFLNDTIGLATALLASPDVADYV